MGELRELLEWGVTKAHQVCCPQGRDGVGLAMVIVEFDLHGVRGKQLNDGAYLTARETMLRQVLKESDFS
jgi:hypothetical protein